ncbi:tRNA lysidine(34) synthetase TilS [Planctomycetota bacterium]
MAGPFFYVEAMLLEFENKLAYFIKAHDLFSSAAKVVLAVSGGADSTALLYAIQALKAENILKGQLLCAHINHQLRGAEADSDEEFVVAEASRLKLDVITKRVDVPGFARNHKLSIETAARQLRMNALKDIAKANHCDHIATAHQKNDNAETVLYRLARGTGFRGLGGIWPRRAFADGMTFIRPMLSVTREEVIEYLQSRSLTWHRDLTNSDCTYRRNFIRHRLFPELQRECSGPLVDTLSELTQSARRFYDRVCKRTDEVWPSLAEFTAERTALDLNKFQSLAPPVKIELIRRCLAHLGCGQRDMTRRHYERIVQLAEQDSTGKRIELPGGFVVRREYGKMIFSQNRVLRYGVSLSSPIELKVPGKTKFGKYLIEATISTAEQNAFEKFVTTKTSYVEYFDLEKVNLSLSVRSRQPGDRFVPLGLGGEKKIGKFLTAQHVPYDVRRKVVLVEDREKIIWVWPIRISEQAKVTSDTRQILRLQITDSGGQ